MAAGGVIAAQRGAELSGPFTCTEGDKTVVVMPWNADKDEYDKAAPFTKVQLPACLVAPFSSLKENTAVRSCG